MQVDQFLNFNKKRQLEFTDLYEALMVANKPPVNGSKSAPVNRSKQSHKKFKSDDDIFNLLVPTSPENSQKPKTEPCGNPLCDHKDFAPGEKPEDFAKPQKELNDIDDIIELGKSYHCKKNKVYFGLNLKTMFNLVKPLTDLRQLVGMKKVKQNIVNQIVFFLQGFNEKDRCGSCVECACGVKCSKSVNNNMLHTVITGPPGVGKTELGKILGQVYLAMGVLTKGHFNIATRSDLIGKYLGHTAAKTQDFINKCEGGVMFIDEAYSLGNPEGRDSFSKECIDTINQNLTEKRNFLCIIAGYSTALEKCFFSYNEGLRRRFTFRYDIEDYTANELAEIFNVKVHKEGWGFEFDVQNDDTSAIIASKTTKRDTVIEFFKKNKIFFPNFGGDIETLFLNCQIYHSKRVIFHDKSFKKMLTVDDILKGFELFVLDRKYKEDSVYNKIDQIWTR